MYRSNTATTAAAAAEAVMLLLHLQNTVGTQNFVAALAQMRSSAVADFGMEGEILNSSLLVEFENYQWQMEKQASKMEAEMLPECCYYKKKQRDETKKAAEFADVRK